MPDSPSDQVRKSMNLHWKIREAINNQLSGGNPDFPFLILPGDEDPYLYENSPVPGEPPWVSYYIVSWGWVERWLEGNPEFKIFYERSPK